MDYNYDHPHTKEVIHAMLAEEMRSFTPSNNYLSHLPYPHLKFANSIALQEEYLRVKKAREQQAASSSSEGMGVGMNAIDMKRYTLQPPDSALEHDVQAWRICVSHAKAQREHQLTRLMNLELAESHIAPVWLGHNAQLEGQEKILTERIQSLKRNIAEVNATRRKDMDLMEAEETKVRHTIFCNIHIHIDFNSCIDIALSHHILSSHPHITTSHHTLSSYPLPLSITIA